MLAGAVSGCRAASGEPHIGQLLPFTVSFWHLLHLGLALLPEDTLDRKGLGIRWLILFTSEG